MVEKESNVKKYFRTENYEGLFSNKLSTSYELKPYYNYKKTGYKEIAILLDFWNKVKYHGTIKSVVRMGFEFESLR